MYWLISTSSFKTKISRTLWKMLQSILGEKKKNKALNISFEKCLLKFLLQWDRSSLWGEGQMAVAKWKKKKKQKNTNIQAKRSSAAIQDRNFEAHVIIQVIKKHGTYISQEIMCSWRSWKRENAVGWGSYQWGYRAFRALGPSSGTAWDSRCARHNIPWAELRDSNPLLHRHGQKTGPLPHRTHMEITWTKDLTDQECDHLKTIFSNESKGRVIHPQSRESLLPTEPPGFNPTVRSFLRRLN